MAYDIESSLSGAEKALKAYAGRTSAGHAEDLICDLLHWLDAAGADPASALKSAEWNWRNERRA